MIRSATAADYPAIRAIVRHAFDRNDEANLVECLRADGEVLVELVCGDEHALTGHALYSRLRIECGARTIGAAALAPVSVLPAFQRQGLGSALIEAGNRACADLGCQAIIVLGHPRYYPRLGFRADLAQTLAAPFSGPSFMALELTPGALAGGGRVQYAKAFGV